MRHLVLLATSLVLIVGFQNCSPSVEFSNSLNSTTSTGTGETEVAMQSFSSSTSSKAIDMVWVIDNSASMTKNVSLVKSNFAAFIKSLGSQVDVNVALISRSISESYNTEISLSDYTSSGTQVHFMVHSYNPMLVAAASTCAASPDSSDAFCTKVKSNSRYTNVYGSLNSFFRSGSQKVFVFVTDDDSSNYAGGTTLQYDSATNPSSTSFDAVTKYGLTENEDYITPSTFTSRMTSAFGSSSAFKSYGFIAYNQATSPCLARQSSNYQSLIESSGGSHFNICDSDWSSSFSKLTSSVVSYAAATYTVSDTAFVSVQSVELNGQTLTQGTDYTVNNNVVTLSSSLVANVGSYTITVNYLRSSSN